MRGHYEGVGMDRRTLHAMKVGSLASNVSPILKGLTVWGPVGVEGGEIERIPPTLFQTSFLKVSVLLYKD